MGDLVHLHKVSIPCNILSHILYWSKQPAHSQA